MDGEGTVKSIAREVHTEVDGVDDGALNRVGRDGIRNTMLGQERPESYVGLIMQIEDFQHDQCVIA